MLRTFKAWAGSLMAGSRFGVLALAAVVAIGCSAAALAQTKSFVRDDLASDGVRLEEQLRKEGAAGAVNKQAAQLRRDAEAALARDPQRALALATSAISADPKVAPSWLLLSRAALAIAPRDNPRALAAAGARHRRGLCRLSARKLAGRTRPPRSPCSARPSHAARSGGPRSTPTAPASPRRHAGRPHRLRGAARGARLPHHRLQGRFRRRLAARLLPVLRSAGARQGRFRALRRRGRRGQRRRHRRGAAALRRRPEARRALRHRAAAGPALGRRREAC